MLIVMIIPYSACALALRPMPMPPRRVYVACHVPAQARACPERVPRAACGNILVVVII